MMAGSVKAIDRQSVHRICSGQVVLNLATAIKELVENSLDAGATNIDIRLKDYGSEVLEVIDNGSGVENNNFQGLTLKHHTSKLRDFSDLSSVDTFGFRGEALSSLCALSNMIVVTCHESAAVGTRLEYDHDGRLVKQTPCPRQHGTTVTLQNLFSTLPVRHKEFLRNLKKEFTKMAQLLQAYGIISSGVKLTCTNQIGQGKRSPVMSTSGNTLLKENIANVFGSKQLQNVMDFVQVTPGFEQCEEYGLTERQVQEQLFKITGYVSKSDHGRGRSSADRQYYYINKRPCDFPKVSKLVNEVYHMYNRHQYPFVALDISLAKDSVDVNVTPDKRKIFVLEEKSLLAMLKTSLQQMYEPRSSVYDVNSQMRSSSGAGTGKTETGGLTSLIAARPPPCTGSATEGNRPDYKGLKVTLAGLKRSFSHAGGSSEINTRETQERVSKQPKLDAFLLKRAKSKPVHQNSTQNNSQSPSQTCSSPSKRSLLSEEIELSKVAPDDEARDVSQEDHKGSNLFLGTSNLERDLPSSSITDSSDDEKRTLGLQNCTSTHSEGDKSNLHVTLPQESGQSEVDICSHLNVLHQSDEAKAAPHCRVLVTDSSTNERKELETPVADCSSVANKAVDKAPKDDEEISTVCREVAEEITSCSTTNSKAGSLLMDDSKFKKTSSRRKEVKVPFSLDRLTEQLKQQTDASCSSRSFSRTFKAAITPLDNSTAEDELTKNVSKDMFPCMEILGQFNLGFIIAKHKRDLFIIDQHATDEKYNFEMLQRHTILQGQRLIQAMPLELTAVNESILIDNLDIFKKNGFDFAIDEEATPTQRVKLTSLPMSKNWTFGKEDIDEVIFMLSDAPGVMCRPSRVRQMFASRSCRKSIMIGTALNQREMKKLVCHMTEIDQPWNCPHGRPTMRHLFNLDMLPD
ncbi:mismatch repair endonuclease PMS2-like [Asterias rubens]|uniref:mismatch repair endonuclease PMS2-like n=1 Tax=Asterias rubens TaxID=7604 RepID=UPI001454F8E4|nr:mismatch repair endonuclease PMS2-like [Asterias rubens]